MRARGHERGFVSSLAGFSSRALFCWEAVAVVLAWLSLIVAVFDYLLTAFLRLGLWLCVRHRLATLSGLLSRNRLTRQMVLGLRLSFSVYLAQWIGILGTKGYTQNHFYRDTRLYHHQSSFYV